MPVHMQQVKTGKNGRKKWQVVDDRGRKYGDPKTRAAAREQVTAMNISMGYVPGMKPRRKK